ncbi:MAG: DUF2442 domain-containing protein [Fretibacterium sp.]|nr:DUF2442 domain-containing protein [Fretibacterium sp.]
MKTPVWSVKSVCPTEDYTLLLTFASGERRVYDARPLLEERLYIKLRNPGFFKKAHAEYGTVVWTDDIDIAPEHLYECSVPAGHEF